MERTGFSLHWLVGLLWVRARVRDASYDRGTPPFFLILPLDLGA